LGRRWRRGERRRERQIELLGSALAFTVGDSGGSRGQTTQSGRRVSPQARFLQSAQDAALSRLVTITLIDFTLRTATITDMIDLALLDEQNHLVQLADVIPRAAATALLPFRGVW
jgi:hypothetical protein